MWPSKKDNLMLFLTQSEFKQGYKNSCITRVYKRATLKFARAFSKCMTHPSTQLKCSKEGGGSWKYPVEKSVSTTT